MKRLSDFLNESAGKRYAAMMRKVGSEYGDGLGGENPDPPRPEDEGMTEILGTFHQLKFMQSIELFIKRAKKKDLEQIEKLVKDRMKEV